MNGLTKCLLMAGVVIVATATLVSAIMLAGWLHRSYDWPLEPLVFSCGAILIGVVLTSILVMTGIAAHD